MVSNFKLRRADVIVFRVLALFNEQALKPLTPNGFDVLMLILQTLIIFILTQTASCVVFANHH